MNLYFRLLWLMLFGRRRAPCPPAGPCITPFQVYPNDLDIFRHVNNGRYFTLLDLARTDLMQRCGLASKLKANGWFPVVIGETMLFRRSLKLWQRFTVETTVMGWDEKSFFVQHRLESRGDLIGTAVVRARFLRISGGSVSCAEIAQLAGLPEHSPVLPDWVNRWVDGLAEQSGMF